jgi:hypothetical protein
VGKLSLSLSLSLVVWHWPSGKRSKEIKNKKDSPAGIDYETNQPTKQTNKQTHFRRKVQIDKIHVSRISQAKA